MCIYKYVYICMCMYKYVYIYLEYAQSCICTNCTKMLSYRCTLGENMYDPNVNLSMYKYLVLILLNWLHNLHIFLQLVHSQTSFW